MTSEVIRVENLCKTFSSGGEVNYALKNVSFSIHQGEFIAISGPSGSGKSTLLSILGLLDTPDSGHYYVNGQSITSLRESEKASVN